MKVSLLVFTLWMVAAVIISTRLSFAQPEPMETMNASGSSHEAGPTHGRMARPARHPLGLERLRRVLGLSEDQAQKMRQLRIEYKKEAIRKGADLRVARLELHELLAQKNVGVPQVEKKGQELTALKGDLMLLRIRSMMKAKAFLNDEQFATFKQIAMHRASHRWRAIHGAAMNRHRGGSIWRRHEKSGGGQSEGAPKANNREGQEAPSAD